MAANPLPSFLSGVIEGFYGRPWTQEQRRVLFERMAHWGLNTYCYSPKDDLKHRAQWRSNYDPAEMVELDRLVKLCRGEGLRFIYALGLGLDIRYGKDSDLKTLIDRFRQLIDIGVQDFALLFDDLPDKIHEEDRNRFGSFAAGHAHVTNAVYDWVTEQVGSSCFLFCPTPYCGRMDNARLGGEGYLEEIGQLLHPEIRIFWTGPEIISKTISEEHLTALSARLQRPPLIWDNLHANDYDLRRLYLGPYSGRPQNPENHLAGILINPNCEFEANFIPVRTLSRYLDSSSRYHPRESYLEALREWLPAFAGVGNKWSLDEVNFLGDLFYLPHESGDLAEAYLNDAMFLISHPANQWQDRAISFRNRASQIEQIFVQLTELQNRDLFYTFNRQWWEMREETQLFLKFLEMAEHADGPVEFDSLEHLPGTFRGGAVQKLQTLLTMSEQGTFKPKHV